jgi:hypothetical protein
MCGEKDPFTGKRNYCLWCCHNERCHESETNRKVFRSMIIPPLGRQRRRAKRAPAAAPTPQPVRPITLPRNLSPIADLPPTHPAPTYLLERHFDPAYLQQVWEISFCVACSDCCPSVTNRIIIPIYRPAKLFAPASNGQHELILAGWQARSIPDLPLPGCNSDPKYLFAAGMRKSELLYGLHLAVASQGPVYLVEGPTDCWRIGPGSVAMFGKALSETQKLLLVHHFAGRPIVVMLDRDARSVVDAIQHELYLIRGSSAGDNRVVIADLPGHREDPADCTPAELVHAITAALGQAPGPIGYIHPTDDSPLTPTIAS